MVNGWDGVARKEQADLEPFIGAVRLFLTFHGTTNVFPFVFITTAVYTLYSILHVFNFSAVIT